jgi:hypothetical protein
MANRRRRREQGHPARIAERREGPVPRWQRDEIDESLDLLERAGVIRTHGRDPSKVDQPFEIEFLPVPEKIRERARDAG